MPTIPPDLDGDPSQPGHDAGANVDQPSDDSASTGSSVESHDNNHFLDIEAAESDNYNDTYDASDFYGDEQSFPQFARLPIELRHRVWDFFDPHMRAPARVFTVLFVEVLPGEGEAWAGPMLENQIAPAQALLSTHRESRALGLKFYPDTLAIGRGEMIIRCHKIRDIVHISSPRRFTLQWIPPIRTLLAGFRQVALDAHIINGLSDEELSPELFDNQFFNGLPDLNRLYLVSEANQHRLHEIQWCVLDSANRYYIESLEYDFDRGEDLHNLFCWPHIADDSQSVKPFKDEPTRGYTGSVPAIYRASGDKIVTEMILFEFGSGLARYDRLRWATFTGIRPDDSRSNSEDDCDSEDEYESEGIDDDTIDEESEGSDESDDLVVAQSAPSDQESSFAGFSPLQGEAPLPSEPTRVESSSMESDSPDAADADGSDSDHVQSRKPLGRQKRTVIDSDDESAKAEADVPATNRRRRVVLSDSGSDSEDGDDEPSAVQIGGARRHGALDDDSGTEEDGIEEDSEDSSGDSSNSEPQTEPRQLSLAEKIGAFRAEVPADEAQSASDAEYDEFNDEGEDDYGPSGYSTFQDDDDDDGSEEHPNHDASIMNLNEEGSDDGGEEW